ncbi:hypothetical protein ASPWEDRAFT_34547 [Aspergillus wentii DTO 134E9]|uniref:Amino acid permease/ SLC12A domain-containing protein n=1 Tax=Aspergillus wentii DTO 134E9 TaxID=1073089 RepID=A0A1L9S1N6_ASPWE|nr:uncharacterized protein ASPWEDRAFT_34547 [Aspergillus wentii DTO 134E9]OJJ41070.1 hypothetical protein ASPWEDRAFT_34547 [Aspergillus wentii DTO 134E9]
MTYDLVDRESESLPGRGPNICTRTTEGDGHHLAPGDDDAYAHEEEERNSPNWGQSLSPMNCLGNICRWRGKGQGNGAQGATRVPHESNHDRKQRTRSMDNSGKLGTFSGVFVPTTLNVLSILMFLRFGFILGQGGFLGTMGLLMVSYTINLVTTMSLSAIATNGTVRGGGAYYLISRSLGPEFGGSIGIVFYLGYAFNTGMNAVGLVDCFTQSFGSETGTWSNFLQEGFWWEYLWGTIILILCTGICLAGSSIFSRASNGLLVILLVATFSIPVSALVVKPFGIPQHGVGFTGLRLQTFLENLKPRLTKGAAGSQLRKKENFQDLFGILFPATGGIFAGASMSGDLKNPSKSIPKGTLSGLALTFVTYTLVVLSMAASITRESFYNNTNVIEVVNISGVVVLLGEFATSFFSALMGVIGSAKLLQAIARDDLLPGINIFSKGTKKHDEPVYAIIVTFILAQLTMLFDINRIASFVTMTYLMTFLVTNLACFFLKIGSAPNFRPSFHYFNWKTAAAGALVSGASMFFVDGIYATGCVGILVFLFLLIHYSSPPKPWGDVSQSLIYHQVRKYLLRLRQEHVKFWRPQILLFVNNLDDQFKMVSFCNSLKKGALFVLGHVLVTDDFSAAVPEARRQHSAWTKFVEYSKVKAFVNITISPSVEWGVRNIVLNSGLGGMRPNIVIIDQYRRDQSLAETWRKSSSGKSSHSHERNDENSDRVSQGPQMNCKSYVTVLEDLLFKLRINVAVAKGFEDLELPKSDGRNEKKYIDLWPIQMSAELGADSEIKQNVLTTNFDTYTLILQLGCILNTVPSWKKTYKLRVSVFVEYETDVEDERIRVEALLEKLRIEAEVMVFWLACGDLMAYRIIVNGDASPATEDSQSHVHATLKDEEWWQDIQNARKREISRDQGRAVRQNEPVSSWQGPSSFESGRRPQNHMVGDLKRLFQSSRRKRSISSFRAMRGINLGMQTHRLLDAFVDYDAIDTTSESSSDDSEFEPYESDDDNESDDSKTISAKSNTGAEMGDESEGLQPPQRSNRASEDSLSPKTVERNPTAGAAESSNSRSREIPTILTTGETNPPKNQAPAGRPSASRRPSSNRFSSAPIPEARVNTDEGVGPSIMFAATSSPTRGSNPPESIYAHHSSSATAKSKKAATGYPSQASIPLSFNDLPSRAQHLILNELMARQSSETAVIFTTLPSPFEGTSQSEEASENYLSNLDVLWQNLPPCLLVHSNSMTVTMNL